MGCDGSHTYTRLQINRLLHLDSHIPKSTIFGAATVANFLFGTHGQRKSYSVNLSDKLTTAGAVEIATSPTPY